MNLGTRRVRSAGRTSGSVEVTLPVQLSLLQGVECRLAMRDGAPPEPELGEARSFFRDTPAEVAGDVCAAPRRVPEAHIARLNIAVSPRGRR